MTLSFDVLAKPSLSNKETMDALLSFDAVPSYNTEGKFSALVLEEYNTLCQKNGLIPRNDTRSTAWAESHISDHPLLRMAAVANVVQKTYHSLQNIFAAALREKDKSHHTALEEKSKLEDGMQKLQSRVIIAESKAAILNERRYLPCAHPFYPYANL